MKKVLVLVLALLMVLPILVACTPTDGPTNTTTTPGGGNDPDNPVVDNTTPPTVTTPANEKAPVLDGLFYEGTEFKVLSRVSDQPTSWGNYDIVYDSESELVVTEIKNAIKDRNDALYDKLGVDVVQVPGQFNEASIAVQSGKHEYDMLLLMIEDTSKLAQQGHLLATSELEHIDTSKAWYDQNALQELAIKGKNYFFFSDITVVNLDATWLFYFNHAMVDKYDLESPYDLLANDEWTLAKLLEMAEAATEDTSSTDKTKDWGLAGHQDLIGSLYVGSGEKIAKATDTGYDLTMNNDRIIEFIDEAIKIRPYWARYSISSMTTSADHVLDRGTDNYAGLMKMYSAGNVLFMAEVLAAARDLTNTETEIDVGILPCPMYEKEQGRYYTPVNDIAAITSLPATAPDAVRTSAIVEYWAYKSHSTLLPAYYEQAQKSRFSKDEISPDVLDEIFAARTYDVGIAYNWGSLYDRLTGLLFDGNTGFSGMYGRYEGVAKIKIQQFVKSFS